MAYISDREARELIVSIAHKMSERGFVSANDGNLSVRVGDRTAWITPTGVNKGELTYQMLLKVDFDGTVLENPGNMNPTCETRMHMNAYRHNDRLMSTCHTHSHNAMVWACLGVALDVAYSPEPVCIIGKVPVAPYGCPGSLALSESIIPFVNDYKCCLLSNHGAMSWGYSPKEAWYVMEALEAYSKLCIEIYRLGLKPRLLAAEQIDEVIELCKPSCATAKNRMRGGTEVVNRKPGINLSEVLGMRE